MTGAILYILLGVVQIVFVIWNRMLSNREIMPEERRKHIKGFVALGAVGLSLTIWIGVHNWNTQKTQAADQAKIQGELQSARKDLDESRLAQEYMKGQLNSLSVLVRSVGDAGQLNAKDLAGYLANMAGSSSFSELSLTNQQLKDRAVDLARRMRIFESRHSDAKERLSSYVLSFEDSPEQKKEEEKREEAEKKLQNQKESEFRSIFLDEANSIRLELLRRLHKPSQRVPLAFEGELEGPSPISDAASYLDSLAKQLPAH